MIAGGILSPACVISTGYQGENGSTLTSQQRGVSVFLITIAIVQHRRALLN